MFRPFEFFGWFCKRFCDAAGTHWINSDVQPLLRTSLLLLLLLNTQKRSTNTNCKLIFQITYMRIVYYSSCNRFRSDICHLVSISCSFFRCSPVFCIPQLGKFPSFHGIVYSAECECVCVYNSENVYRHCGLPIIKIFHRSKHQMNSTHTHTHIPI